MRNLVVAFIVGGILTSVPFSIFAANYIKRQPEVLAEKTTPTQTLTPSPSPTPTPTPTETPSPSPTATVKPKPTSTPTPTAAPRPTFTSQEINGFIDRFATQYGVDANILRHIAICESGFDQFAQSAAYAGLFQFGPITWANIRKEIGEDTNPDLRLNAEESAQTAAYALSQGKTSIWPSCIP